MNLKSYWINLLREDAFMQILNNYIHELERCLQYKHALWRDYNTNMHCQPLQLKYYVYIYMYAIIYLKCE